MARRAAVWLPVFLVLASVAAGDVSPSIADLVPRDAYSLDAHSVTTQDGYILGLFRLQTRGTSAGRTSTSPSGTSQKPVVALLHGLLDSCAGMLLQGPGKALGFLLADAGFDVWLLNVRGSTHSRQHAWLPLSGADYWAFSFDEMAQYDLPTSLAYVRGATGAPRVHFASHSQGGTIMLAALSSQPQLAAQLGLVALMAPVASAHHATSWPLQVLATMGTDAVFTLLGVHEFLPSVRVLSFLEGQLCTASPDLCVSILAAICGYHRGAVNVTRLPLYLEYTPAGTSVQNLAHWAQNMRGGSSPGPPALTWFDYGTTCGPAGRQHTCNQEVYGTLQPPQYALYNIPRAARMIIFTGGQDRLADPLDSEHLLEALPAGVLADHIHLPEYEHLDFIWGQDAGVEVYTPLIAAMQAHDAELSSLQHEALRSAAGRRGGAPGGAGASGKLRTSGEDHAREAGELVVQRAAGGQVRTAQGAVRKGGEQRGEAASRAERRGGVSVS